MALNEDTVDEFKNYFGEQLPRSLAEIADQELTTLDKWRDNVAIRYLDNACSKIGRSLPKLFCAVEDVNDPSDVVKSVSSILKALAPMHSIAAMHSEAKDDFRIRGLGGLERVSNEFRERGEHLQGAAQAIREIIKQLERVLELE